MAEPSQEQVEAKVHVPAAVHEAFACDGIDCIRAAWLGDADFALHLKELSLSVSQLKPDCQRFFIGASAKWCSRSAVTPLPHGHDFHTATRRVPRQSWTAATSLRVLLSIAVTTSGARTSNHHT